MSAIVEAWLSAERAAIGSLPELRRRAQELVAAGELRAAASAYDRMYGLDPTDATIAGERRELLDRLAVVEHGLTFRYVPAGTFLMGSESGDPDESPVHPVRLDGYWLSETTVSWASYCDLMGWEPPPAGMPVRDADTDDQAWRASFVLRESNKIRLQYCEDDTIRARDWHAHDPAQRWRSGGRIVDAQTIFGTPERNDPRRPWRYDRKPMVSVAVQEAEELCELLSTPAIRYRLPTEAEWERAARGGLVGCRYPWGNEPPTRERCDMDRFEEFSILPVRQLPPNGYGLYGMAGSVWEWTADWYDAEYYRESPAENPTGPAEGTERVLRGGSWADSADTVTVSFRMSASSRHWRDGDWGAHMTPTIGFRICRTERSTPLVAKAGAAARATVARATGHSG